MEVLWHVPSAEGDTGDWRGWWLVTVSRLPILFPYQDVGWDDVVSLPHVITQISVLHALKQDLLYSRCIFVALGYPSNNNLCGSASCVIACL